MDPITAFAVAGNALQFVDVAIKALKALCRYISDANDASKQATELRNEISAMIGITTTLRVTLETTPSSIPATQGQALSDAIKHCMEILQDILQNVEECCEPAKTTGFRKMTWPFQKGKSDRFLKKIERYKATLNCALQIEQRCVISVVINLIATHFVILKQLSPNHWRTIRVLTVLRRFLNMCSK